VVKSAFGAFAAGCFIYLSVEKGSQRVSGRFIAESRRQRPSVGANQASRRLERDCGWAAHDHTSPSRMFDGLSTP
jgi:hypothetical protein